MILSPDGRYRLVEENDERIDERLRSRLRLEVVETGEILFDARSTLALAASRRAVRLRRHGGGSEKWRLDTAWRFWLLTAPGDRRAPVPQNKTKPTRTHHESGTS